MQIWDVAMNNQIVQSNIIDLLGLSRKLGIFSLYFLVAEQIIKFPRTTLSISCEIIDERNECLDNEDEVYGG